MCSLAGYSENDCFMNILSFSVLRLLNCQSSLCIHELYEFITDIKWEFGATLYLCQGDSDGGFKSCLVSLY